MIIKKAEVWPVQIPYIKPYVSSRGELTKGCGVILRLTNNDGIQGVGEASFLFPDRSGETIESVLQLLKVYFIPLLIGINPFQFKKIMHLMDQVAGDAFSFPYTRAAIDIALNDLRARCLNLPLATLLGGAFRKRMTVGRSLSVQPIQKLVAQAKDYASQGYKMLTLKGRSDWNGDIKRFLAVREAIGPEILLEIDPNQAYSVKGAIALVRSLEKAGLSNLEQPCKWWDLEGLKRITDASGVRVTADEAVMCPADVMRVARMRAADMITLKLARVGGINQAEKMFQVAKAAGLSCNIGSKHTFGIGTAALLHFAAVYPGISEPLGYGTPLERFIDDIIQEEIPFNNGVVCLPDGFGLGVTLDEKKLEKYSQGYRMVMGSDGA